MSISRIRAVVLLGAATLTAGAIALAQDHKAPATGAPGRADVFNSIEGRMIVLTSRPAGAKVEKGDVVCELDATDLQERMVSQELMVKAAETELLAATLAREVAALSVPDFLESGYLEQLRAVEVAIKLAEAELVRAEDQLDWSRRMFAKGYYSLAAKINDELKLKAARFALEQAQSKKKRLVDHTRDKTTKELQGALVTAKARELTQQAVLARERLAQRRLVDQVRRSKLTAPVSGRVQYAIPIGPGAVVRDGKLVFAVVPDSQTDAAN